MISRDTVELLSKIAQKLSKLKLDIADTVGDKSKYMELREHINDCQDMMAIYCNCAPIRLINGNIDEILINY